METTTTTKATVKQNETISRDLTALSPREQAALVAECDFLLDLLQRARLAFSKDYADYLDLEVNKGRAQYRQQILSGPAVLRSTFTPETPAVVQYTGDHEQARRRCLLAACASLHNAAVAALQSCQRIALIMYRAYAGAGRLDLMCVTNPKPNRGRQTINPQDVMERMTRKMDRNTFRLVIEVAEQLRRLSGSGANHPVRAEHRFEGIQMAIEKMVADLSGRDCNL